MTVSKHDLFKTFISFSAVSLFVLVCSATAPAGTSADKVACRIETDRSVLPVSGPSNTVLKVTLDAPMSPKEMTRPPVNLALILDQSGSMTGTKIEKAKAAAIEALTRLGVHDMFSVVVYDTNVRTIVPSQNASNTRNIISVIRNIRAGGSTNLFGGVSQGAAEIRKHLENSFVHRMILLSDGLANVGTRNPSDLGRLGAALLKENISVTTVGVGTDYNEDLMAQLAQKSDGNTYFVESGVDLPRIFAAELGDVLNVVAKKVRVIITLPDNIKAVDIIGRQGRIRKNSIELSMNQLYGNQEKYALIEVEIPDPEKNRLNGTQMKIADARVEYLNPFTGKKENSHAVSYVSFSGDKEKIEKSTNVDVVREYQLNLNALAQEKAIELSDQGRKEEAVSALKQSAVKLKAIGSMYREDALIEQAQEIEERARDIEQEGMTKKSRKLMRTESYQMKNQQMKK